MRPNLVFYFHIDFENLGQRELGLMCYAIRPTAHSRHKIGMGKPLGLGKVRIDPVGLFYVDRQVRYRETSLFEAPRYHGIWIPAEENPQAWPACYAREQQAVGQGTITFPAFDTLRQVFMGTMDEDICRALELLGDPAQVRHAVRTPQVAGVSGAEMEEKTYKWFVANDIGAGSEGPQQAYLQPLSASSPGLPTLPESHNWND